MILGFVLAALIIVNTVNKDIVITVMKDIILDMMKMIMKFVLLAKTIA
jgi:hypothetical protein